VLTLINSLTYGVGSSTLVYFMAKTRSSLLSKPALIISSSDSLTYRHMLPVANDWENPNLKMVLSKLQTYTDIKTFCYKVDSYLYYLNIEGSDLKTQSGRKEFNQLLREIKQDGVHEGFESIWVDLDNLSGGFMYFVDDVDLVLVPVPPNIIKLTTISERILHLRQGYVADFGMQMKIPIYYCVLPYASQLPLTKIKTILNTSDKYIIPVGYDVEIVRQFNQGKLHFYLNEVLAEPKTTEQKTLHTHLKRLLKDLKPQRR